MGNWMTIRIIGTCAGSDLPALERAIRYNYRDSETPDNFTCLSHTGGLAGLPMWARENIDVVGNCAERDFYPGDVAEALMELVKKAPSLSVKVHCGGSYESQECVATVTLENGIATVGDPEVGSVGEISEAQMVDHFLLQMIRGG